jgi:hypothetical protein
MCSTPSRTCFFTSFGPCHEDRERRQAGEGAWRLTRRFKWVLFFFSGGFCNL